MGAEAGRRAGGDGEGAGAGVAASGWERGKAGVRVCAVGSAGLGLTARRTLPAPPSRRRGRRPAGLWLTSGAGMARGQEPGPSLSSPPRPFVPQPLWPPGRIHALSDSDLKESDSLLCPRRQILSFYFISLVGDCVYECVCVCVCVCERERECVCVYARLSRAPLRGAAGFPGPQPTGGPSVPFCTGATLQTRRQRGLRWTVPSIPRLAGGLVEAGGRGERGEGPLRRPRPEDVEQA